MERIDQPIDIILQPTIDIEPHQMSEMVDCSSFFDQPPRPIYLVPTCHLQKVREYFLAKDWILLPIRKEINVMHLCPRIDYEESIQQYMTTADNFSQIESYQLDGLFDSVVDRIERTLSRLWKKGKITSEQYHQMIYSGNVHQKSFDDIFFGPVLNQNMLSMEPCIIFDRSPTKNLCDYLYGLLNKRYTLLSSSMYDADGMDLIQSLENYTRAGGFLTEETVFGCIELKELDRYLSHYHMIHALERYLKDYMTNDDLDHLSRKTIVLLADMALRSQFYCYKENIYRKNRGGCQEVPLFRLLTNIFLVYLQSDLYEIFHEYNEVFGRYHNKIICTWNAQPMVLHTLFELFMDIRFDLPIVSIQIGQKIQILNVQIENQQGTLITKMARSAAIQHFDLFAYRMFSTHFYSRKLRSTLLQRIEMCSQLDDFYVSYHLLRQHCLLAGIPIEMLEKISGDLLVKCQNGQTTYSSLRSRIQQRKRTYSELSLDDDIQPIKHFRSSSFLS